MANVRISDLAQTNTLTGSEFVEVSQAGKSRKARSDLFSAIVVPSNGNSLILAASDPVDLVDTAVALNVGAANPDGSPHIEISPSEVQAKGDATNAVTLNLNPLGGNVLIGAQSGTGRVEQYNDGILRTQTEIDGGFTVYGDDNLDTSFKSLVFKHQNGTIRGFVAMNASGAMQLQNLIDGGEWRVEVEDSGANNRVAIVVNPDLDVTLWHPLSNFEVARTIDPTAGGLEANNTFTGSGWERVLTTSDGIAPGALPLGSLGDMVYISTAPNIYSATSDVSYDSTNRQLVLTNDGTPEPLLSLNVGNNPSNAITIDSTLSTNYVALRMNDQTGGNYFLFRHDYGLSSPNHEFRLESSAFGTIWEIENEGNLYLGGTEASAVLKIQVSALFGNGEVLIDNGATLYFEEIAAAQPDNAGQGQLWVRNDTPNVLVFTDDTGVDTVLGGGGGTTVDPGTADGQVLLWDQTTDTAWEPSGLLTFSESGSGGTATINLDMEAVNQLQFTNGDGGVILMGQNTFRLVSRGGTLGSAQLAFFSSGASRALIYNTHANVLFFDQESSGVTHALFGYPVAVESGQLPTVTVDGSNFFASLASSPMVRESHDFSYPVADPTGACYRFNNPTAAADPGPTFMRVNNVSFASATELYFDDLSVDNSQDMAWWFNTMAVGDMLRLHAIGFPDRWLQCTIDSITDNVGWYTVGITVVDSLGTVFINGDDVQIQVQKASTGGVSDPLVIGSVNATDNSAITLGNNVAALNIGNPANPGTLPIMEINSQFIQTKSSKFGTAPMFVNSLGGDINLGASGNSRVVVDNGVDVALFHSDGAEVANTRTALTGGFFVNNTLTGAGFERVLTASDLPTNPVGVSGTPSNNQIAIWVNSTDIEGDPDLTYDGISLAVRDSTFFVEDTVGADSITISVTGGEAFLNATGGTTLIQLSGAPIYIPQGSLFIAEKAAADADVAGRGQVWVSNVPNPNELYYTDESGNDISLVSELWQNGGIRIAGTLLGIDVTNSMRVGTASTGAVKINEGASALVDEAGYGQHWVRDDVPNNPMFTDDAGNDFEVGFARARVTLNSSFNFNTANNTAYNRVLYYADGTNNTITLENSTGTAQWPVGTSIQVIAPGSGVQTLTEGTGTTLFLEDGTDTVGGGTISGGAATIFRASTTDYIFIGSGFTT